MGTLSAEAVAFYAEQGYLLVPGVALSRLTGLRREIDGVQPEAEAWRGAWIDPTEQASLVAKHGVHRGQTWREFIADPEWLSAIRSVMGSEPVFDHSTLVTKPPTTGQPFPPHQDAVYYGDRDAHYVVASIFLDDATDDNGPIQVLPRSHANGLRRHTRSGNKAYLQSVDVRQMVPVMGRAGDAVLFSLFTVHGSLPNRSSLARRAVRVGYRRAR